jgi:hypothetical protein
MWHAGPLHCSGAALSASCRIHAVTENGVKNWLYFKKDREYDLHGYSINKFRRIHALISLK